MSIPLPLSPLPKKLEDLQAQRDYLLLLRDHHLLWSKSTDDPSIIRMHIEIIDLLYQMEVRYEDLQAVLLSQSK